MSEYDETHGPAGTIPVEVAIELTANWRKYLTTSNPAFATQSFLLPMVDFQNIVKYNPDAEGVRVYLGLEDATDPTSAKLVLVPVSKGADVVHLKRGNGDPDGSNVFDLSKACPPICPVASVLNS
jgi:hypothetical protein